MWLSCTAPESERVKVFLKSMTKASLLIRATVRLVTVPAGSEFTVGTFTPQEVQAKMRQASLSKGFEVETLPTLVLESGQPGEVARVSRKAFFNDTAWEGDKLELELALRGEGVTGSFQFERRRELNLSLAGPITQADQDTLIQEIETPDKSIRFPPAHH